MTATPGTPAEAKERDACLCSCGGFPSKRSSRYLPGHDAKHHAALKRAAKEERGEVKPKAKRRKAAAA